MCCAGKPNVSLKDRRLLPLDRNSISDYCCPFCDEGETVLAVSPSSNNNLTNFQPLQIPLTKSQVPHLIGSLNVELQNPLPHILVQKSTKQGNIIPFWNVVEHTENEASQSKIQE
jgi:hypothetical protein